mmetsp:Transcript_117089/g.233342  ORF Transcript_117089/g.233342 Transcript_117089/m.233342 type:complete len:229 (-) Transcript_117089:967-1653(-)
MVQRCQSTCPDLQHQDQAASHLQKNLQSNCHAGGPVLPHRCRSLRCSTLSIARGPSKRHLGSHCSRQQRHPWCTPNGSCDRASADGTAFGCKVGKLRRMFRRQRREHNKMAAMLGHRPSPLPTAVHRKNTSRTAGHQCHNGIQKHTAHYCTLTTICRACQSGWPHPCLLYCLQQASPQRPQLRRHCYCFCCYCYCRCCWCCRCLHSVCCSTLNRAVGRFASSISSRRH